MKAVVDHAAAPVVLLASTSWPRALLLPFIPTLGKRLTAVAADPALQRQVDSAHLQSHFDANSAAAPARLLAQQQLTRLRAANPAPTPFSV